VVSGEKRSFKPWSSKAFQSRGKASVELAGERAAEGLSEMEGSLTIFFKAPAQATQLAPDAPERLPTPRPLPENLPLGLPRKLPLRPLPPSSRSSPLLPQCSPCALWNPEMKSERAGEMGKSHRNLTILFLAPAHQGCSAKASPATCST